MSTEAGKRHITGLRIVFGLTPEQEDAAREDIEDIEAEAVAAERVRIAAAMARLRGHDCWDEADSMCPNCVTPWKCNGPHESPERDPMGHHLDRAAVLAIVQGEQPP